MSSHSALLLAVLHTVSADSEQNPRDTLCALHYPDTFLAQASLLEQAAEATWRVLRHSDPTLADSLTVYFLVRPFDDGDARLVVIERDQVIFNDCWPLAGSFKIWQTAVNDLAMAIRARAAHYPAASPA